MKGKIRFKSIKSRLTFWFLLVALLPLIVVSIVISQQRASGIKENAFDKLTAIRDLKVDQVNLWLDERISDIKAISEDEEIRSLYKIFNKQKYAENDIRIFRHGTELLKRYVEIYKAYEEVFIINPRSEKTELSTNKARIGIDKSQDQNFTEPMRTGNVYIKDIYYSKTTHKPSMTFSIPIYGKGENKQIVGILVTRVDLEHSLYDLLLDRTGMGNTGETLIVNKDGVALNELRWYSRAPLKLKIEAKPALMASQGKAGITETGDYRGEQVLAAYTYIPRTRWGFVAKQDLKEVYAPVQVMLFNILIIFLISIAVVYILAYFVAGNIARPILEMTKVSKRIQEGDLSARNHVVSEDELGFLARSINNTADSMESKILVQEKVADINTTMVIFKGLQDFAEKLLQKLIETTGSNLGAFHLLTKDGAKFDLFSSVGVSPELLEPFDATGYEGELGKAVAAKEISHIREIPEDTVFKFKTFTGTLFPKEIITIPIATDEKVVAVISLASLNPYSKEILEILNQTWLGMNTAFSNLVANEQTIRLAEELGQKNQELEAQSEELQSQAEELQQTAEELQEQNLELDAQRLQVEEANRLKGEFLSNMSHELRTPLNSVMALSRVLLRQTKDKLSEEEWSYLEIIERNGKNLLSLINDILDLSKIEAGKMDISPKPFSVASTIETIMERLEPLAEDKGVELNQEILDDLPQIESDENRVHQILQNLIGNAVKFTTEGSVTASARSDDENIHIEVADTGIGISKKDLPHIFEEFRQVDGTSSRPYEGTGLGLTIAFRTARMLGGEISVESTLGKGSTFTLTLPVRWQEMAPVSEPATFKPPAGIAPARKTVLVVDDEPDALTMISSYLSGEGYNIITASSGAEAIRLAQRHRPFAITLDIIMPEMDGLEVLQHLKQNPDTKEIPVIIVSISDDKSTGIALGAVGYISKPVNRDLLIAEINRIGGPSVYTIVVADDNEIELKEMTRTIEQEGMQAIAAKDGKICMDLIKESVPDVLVLDLIMPEMDGFGVLDRVRSDPGTKDLPVIVVTAKDLTREEREKLSDNVSSVLAKSETTSTALLEEIKKTLAGIERRKKGARAGGREAFDRILLVEDDEAAVIQVKAVLENAGYVVDVVRGGQEALDYMLRIIPGGVILDLMMPEVDGFQVLEKMRSTEATAKVPVLVLTARDLTPEDLSKLNVNNIKQLVQKGDVDQESLLFKVRSMLRGKAREVAKIRDPKPQTRQQESTRARKTAGTPTILVVEDNPDNMISIKAVLQNKYSILEATDGESALNMALTERPELILLDMSLPKIDGFTVVRKVKEDKKAGHIPVIAMTARVMKGDREKIIEAGCDDYISKPIEPEDVLNKIKDWLKK